MEQQETLIGNGETIDNGLSIDAKIQLIKNHINKEYWYKTLNEGDKAVRTKEEIVEGNDYHNYNAYIDGRNLEYATIISKILSGLTISDIKRITNTVRFNFENNPVAI